MASALPFSPNWTSPLYFSEHTSLASTSANSSDSLLGEEKKKLKQDIDTKEKLHHGHNQINGQIEDADKEFQFRR